MKENKSETAFVYLWYDAPNDMYYLGKHKGSPYDEYTHSSSIWEHFTKDNIPEGVTREILAAGTEEEMRLLESKLLRHAKNLGVWDKYYNDNLSDLDIPIGESVWTWDEKIVERRRAYWKVYGKTPQKKAYEKKRRQDPERKAYMKKYRARKKAERQGEGMLEAYL